MLTCGIGGLGRTTFQKAGREADIESGHSIVVGNITLTLLNTKVGQYTGR